MRGQRLYYIRGYGKNIELRGLRCAFVTDMLDFTQSPLAQKFSHLEEFVVVTQWYFFFPPKQNLCEDSIRDRCKASNPVLSTNEALSILVSLG